LRYWNWGHVKYGNVTFGSSIGDRSRLRFWRLFVVWGSLACPIWSSNAIIQPNGNTVITAIGADKNLYLNWQSSTTFYWSGWQTLGSGAGGFATTPSMVVQPNGDTVIAAIGMDGNLYLNWQSSTTFYWSGWESLGSGGGGFATTPSIVVQPNGNTVITAIGMDGNLYLSWQSSTTFYWSGWESLGSGGGGFANHSLNCCAAERQHRDYSPSEWMETFI